MGSKPVCILKIFSISKSLSNYREESLRYTQNIVVNLVAPVMIFLICRFKSRPDPWGHCALLRKEEGVCRFFQDIE